MSAATELLARVRQRGIEVRMHAGHIGVRPAAALTPELRAELEGRKAELIAVLEAEADLQSPCYCCGSQEFWRPRSGGPWVCPRCHPPGPPEDQIERLVVAANRPRMPWHRESGAAPLGPNSSTGREAEVRRA